MDLDNWTYWKALSILSLLHHDRASNMQAPPPAPEKGTPLASLMITALRNGFLIKDKALMRLKHIRPLLSAKLHTLH